MANGLAYGDVQIAECYGCSRIGVMCMTIQGYVPYEDSQIDLCGGCLTEMARTVKATEVATDAATKERL